MKHSLQAALAALIICLGVAGLLPAQDVRWVGNISATNVTSGTLPAAPMGNTGALRAKLLTADLNVTTDQSIAIGLPTSSTNYRLQNFILSNPSISMTTAVCGLWTAAGKTGTTIVGSGATGVAMSGLTTGTVATSGSMLLPTVNNTSSAYYNSATLYFACSTAQGAAATADVVIEYQPVN